MMTKYPEVAGIILAFPGRTFGWLSANVPSGRADFMTQAALVFGDYAFFILHTALIVFSIVGWAFRSTRTLHLVAFVVTSLSWFVIGPMFCNKLGWCVCTHYHLMIRSALEYQSEINYIDMLVNRISGGTINLGWERSEWAAGIVYAMVFIATTITWIVVIVRSRRRVENLPDGPIDPIDPIDQTVPSPRPSS